MFSYEFCEISNNLFFTEHLWSTASEKLTLKSISPYSVWMRENTDQKNSEYGHFWRSDCLSVIIWNKKYSLKNVVPITYTLLKKHFSVEATFEGLWVRVFFFFFFFFSEKLKNL